MSSAEYLGVADVIKLARIATGIDVIVRNREALESAVGQPTMSMFGKDLYPDLASKAAVLWFCIDHNQPFMDGNKRAAIHSAEAFLELNGWCLDLSDGELYDLALRVADNDVKNPGELADVLRLHARPA